MEKISIRILVEVILPSCDKYDGSEPSYYFKFLLNPLNYPDCDRTKWVKDDEKLGTCHFDRPE